MHPPSHLHHRTPSASASRFGRPARDADLVEALLGAAHPLARVLRQWQTTLEQGLAVAVLGVLGALGVLVGVGQSAVAPLLLAVAVVQTGLSVRLWMLSCARRQLCLELIAAGVGPLPLRAFEAEWLRLQDPACIRRLARSLDRILAVAARPQLDVAGPRPLFSVRVARAVSPELREVAHLLRTGTTAVRGVAVLEHLLTTCTSPLYGSDVAALREELRRLRYLLAT